MVEVLVNSPHLMAAVVSNLNGNASKERALCAVKILRNVVAFGGDKAMADSGALAGLVGLVGGADDELAAAAFDAIRDVTKWKPKAVEGVRGKAVNRFTVIPLDFSFSKGQ